MPLRHRQSTYTAYRHQLNGVQYAEIAVMDSKTMDDEDGTETAAE